MTKNELKNSIIADLGANYQESDSELLGALLDEVINDALIISNRQYTLDIESEETLEKQITILASEIRLCVKSIYLQRGSEDVSSISQLGISSVFEDAKRKMREDIIKGNKRVLV